jgi:hypothetical protein
MDFLPHIGPKEATEQSFCFWKIRKHLVLSPSAFGMPAMFASGREQSSIFAGSRRYQVYLSDKWQQTEKAELLSFNSAPAIVRCWLVPAILSGPQHQTTFEFMGTSRRLTSVG